MESSTNKILVDTNILIYLVDDNSPFYISDPTKIFKKNDEIYIPDRVLVELYRVLTGFLKRSSTQALEIIDFYRINSKFEIIYSSEESMHQTFELAQEHNCISGKIFDLEILSIALIHNIDIFYTKNIKDFPVNTAIQIVDPTLM